MDSKKEVDIEVINTAGKHELYTVAFPLLGAPVILVVMRRNVTR